MSILRRSRRWGSGSMMLQNSQRMEFGAILERLHVDLEAQPPLGIRLDDVAELPADGIRRDPRHQAADGARRHNALAQAPEDAAHADVDLEHVKLVVGVHALQIEGDVVDPDDLAALGVDDLLVEQVAPHPQHPDVVVVGNELLVAEVDPVEGDRRHLVVADGPPVPLAPHEKLVDPDLVDARRETGVPDPADAAALQVEDPHAHQLGEKEQAAGHGTAPPGIGRVVEGEREPLGGPERERANLRLLIPCEAGEATP
jgi:hypothetical protein